MKGNKRIKYLLFMILAAAALSACNKKDSETITIKAITPYYIVNEMGFSAIDENYLMLPVKSVKSVKSKGNLSVEFVKPDKYNKNPELFRYGDLKKYSVLKFNFNSDKLINSHGIYYTQDFCGVIELELYKDEIKKSSLEDIKDFMYFCKYGNDTLIILYDFYNGESKGTVIGNTFTSNDGALKGKIYSEEIKKIYESMYSDTLRNDEFLRVADEVKKNFKSDSDYDKAKAIYNWIVSNIKANDSSVARYLDIADKGENIPSIKNTLRKKETMCLGFTYLFDALAKYHGLNSYIKSGIGGGSLHYWNTVMDREKSIFVDCTFGTKNATDNFTYAPNDSFSSSHLVWNEEINRFSPQK
jgi:hypothetical protein